jgi:molybdenum cofactor guanylyltransferase
VLAGGRGQRMGGLDKGLQLLRGAPLAAHALSRLQPQVGGCMISANRNLDRYGALGVPVWQDDTPDHPGPLAGMLTAMRHADTPWLACVPCDGPDFPVDLVARLAAAAAQARVPVAYACAWEADPTDPAQRRLRQHPVYALMATHLHDSLAEALANGERRVMKWMQAHGAAEVVFDDANAFLNVNTLDDLALRHGTSAA